MEKEKKLVLENSRPLSPWGPLDSLSTCLGTDSLIWNDCRLFEKKVNKEVMYNHKSTPRPSVSIFQCPIGKGKSLEFHRLAKTSLYLPSTENTISSVFGEKKDNEKRNESPKGTF